MCTLTIKSIFNAFKIIFVFLVFFHQYFAKEKAYITARKRSLTDKCKNITLPHSVRGGGGLASQHASQVT